MGFAVWVRECGRVDVSRGDDGPNGKENTRGVAYSDYGSHALPVSFGNKGGVKRVRRPLSFLCLFPRFLFSFAPHRALSPSLNDVSGFPAFSAYALPPTHA